MREFRISLSGEVTLVAENCNWDVPLPWGGTVPCSMSVPDSFPRVQEVCVTGPVAQGVLVLTGDMTGGERRFELPALTSESVWRHVLGLPVRVASVSFVPDSAEQVAGCDHDGFPSMPVVGQSVSVECERCHHVTAHALGTLDPKEARCAHTFALRRESGVMGRFVCTNCQLAVDVHTLVDAGIEPTRRYSKDGNELADEAQRLRDENVRVLADNARLRMRVERLERRGGR